MEKAIFLGKGRKDLEGFSRIYYGAEFCEHLLPTEKELDGVLDSALQNRKDFTLVTPYATNPGIKRIERLLKTLSRKMPSAEVVFNDFGVLGLVNEKGLMPVMGRLLARQKNDPRTVMLKGKIGRKAYDYFQRTNLELKEMQDFLLSNNVKRAEVDNLLQGIKLPRLGKISFSLHYPEVYVSTTRLCMANSCDRIKDRLDIRVDGCARECLKYRFELKDRTFPVRLFIRGNTQFYENRGKENFGMVDRVVYVV